MGWWQWWLTIVCAESIHIYIYMLDMYMYIYILYIFRLVFWEEIGTVIETRVVHGFQHLGRGFLLTLLGLEGGWAFPLIKGGNRENLFSIV